MSFDLNKRSGKWENRNKILKKLDDICILILFYLDITLIEGSFQLCEKMERALL